MKAVCWQAPNKVAVEDVPDPEIVNPRDAILKVTTTCICGSDLHLLDGYVPAMQAGDIMGHEFMGEVVEVGREVKNVSVGDRVLVPFNIACGHCWFCEQTLFSLCDNSNPDAAKLEKAYGYAGSGLFGYSHLYGGYAGGQAEYVRVPIADTGAQVIPEHLPDEKVIFLTDIFPTGYMAAENCDIREGDTVAVWGAGPVGQFAARSAKMLGAGRVIVIDRFEARLRMAAEGGAETLNYEDVGGTMDIADALRDLTAGRGPDSCIDAVGMEAHGVGMEWWYDRAKQALRMETDRPIALRQAIQACRKGGVVSIPGVYGGLLDKVNFGAAFAKALTFRMGQTHTHRYLRPLLERVERGDIDPSFVITHSMNLEDAPDGYRIFKEKEDECVKVVMTP